MPLTGSQVEAIFGKFPYKELGGGNIIPDSQWVQNSIVLIKLPIFGAIRCHKIIAPALAAVAWDLECSHMGIYIDADDFRTSGGCWVPRHMLWNETKPLSRHSWGCAIDVNTKTNGYGKKPSDSQIRISPIFEKWGFEWGGYWSTPDPMHFEAVRFPAIPAT